MDLVLVGAGGLRHRADVSLIWRVCRKLLHKLSEQPRTTELFETAYLSASLHERDATVASRSTVRFQSIMTSPATTMEEEATGMVM
jgi:hypothetical protein